MQAQQSAQNVRDVPVYAAITSTCRAYAMPYNHVDAIRHDAILDR